VAQHGAGQAGQGGVEVVVQSGIRAGGARHGGLAGGGVMASDEVDQLARGAAATRAEWMAQQGFPEQGIGGDEHGVDVAVPGWLIVARVRVEGNRGWCKFR
jgi:hypothetical protein